MTNQWQSTDGRVQNISEMNDMHLLYAYRKVAETLISEENDELEDKGVMLFDEIRRRKLEPLAPRSELDIHNSKKKAEQKRKRAEEKANKLSDNEVDALFDKHVSTHVRNLKRDIG